MNILVIDNYDSFTYNLVALLRQIPGAAVTVRRNDAAYSLDLERADALVLSPGPGLPAEAGDLMAILGQAAGHIPVLGVCLGLQAIGEFYGGSLHNLSNVYHGVATAMQVVDREDPLFFGLPEIFQAGRYHSWVVDPNTLPPELRVSAIDETGHIMALRHHRDPVFGVQFHPESVLTPQGALLIQNFVGQAQRLIAA
ncbi:MAG: aminodeoxychorismate/anthranilate synthase component II [Bacteroidetes bacterium]|nr:aminodeoxychorismate/anthranilate synthase component II [Bacteroidota bacterium]